MMPIDHAARAPSGRPRRAPCRPAGRRTRRAAAAPAAVVGLERGHHLIALLRGRDALLERQADQHVARAAEVLHLRRRARPSLLERARAPCRVGRLRVLHLDHRAAGELDREVQPARARGRTPRRGTSAAKSTLNTNACRMNGMSRRMRKNSMVLLSLLASELAVGRQPWRRRRAGLPHLCRSTRLQLLLAAVPEVDDAARERTPPRTSTSGCPGSARRRSRAPGPSRTRAAPGRRSAS